ncbi:MAG: lysophospholipid acyltransferase family protein, partial [Candidatus Eiseniibacteriota bacterium]
LGVRARVARENLARAFPERTEGERAAIAREAYAQAGMMAIEHLRFPLLRPETLDRIASSIEGLDHIAAARGRGHGAVLLTGHFGAFELFGGVAVRAGNPISLLVRGQTNPLVDRMMSAHRRALGVNVLGHGRGVRDALKTLNAGECVAVIADQDAGRDGLFVDFFGTPASTPPGPAEFCVRTGAPLVMGYLRRLSDGRHEGRIFPPIDPPQTGDHEADVRALTEAHTHVLEGWIRDWPEQWLWTHRRWKSSPAPAPRGALQSAASVLAVTAGLLGMTLGAPATAPAPAAAPAAAETPRTLPAFLDSARAGESVFDGAGSSVFPLGPSRVRRIFEGVRIRRTEAGWTIDAEEVFQAGIAPGTAAMGLPDYRASLAREDSGAGRPRGTVKNLVVSVDGLPMGVNELPGSAAPGEDLGGIERLYRFEVPFGAVEIRTVRLEYAVGDSRTDRGEPLLFFYLNPGSLWEGESAKVTVSVDLGTVPPDDLIIAWLRPRGSRVYGSQVIWRRGAGDEVQDIALAYRPFADPLAPYSDRKKGPLALSLEAREEWYERLTPNEMRFWAAWLVARRGGPVPTDGVAKTLAAEPWYEPERKFREQSLSKDERTLLARLRDSLAEWDRARVSPMTGDPMKTSQP